MVLLGCSGSDEELTAAESATTELSAVQPSVVSSVPQVGASESESAPTSDPVPTRVAAPSEPMDPVSEQPITEPRATQSPIEQAFGLLTDPVVLSEAYAAAYGGFALDVTTCLSDRGFSYRQQVDPAPPPSDFVFIASANSTTTVRQFGYGFSQTLDAVFDTSVPASAPDSPISIANREMFDSLSDAGRDSFRIARGECFDEAAERLVLPDDISDALAAEIQEVRQQAANELAAIDVWGDWSTCMARAGFVVQNREVAKESVLALFNETVLAFESGGSTDAATIALAAEVRQFERRITDADIECAVSVDLDARLLDSQTRYEAEWLEANGDRVTLLLGEEG